ncbi:DUF4377 domain-containing protein [Polaribacter cellanae]|uniref:DUF4377 domain-containing protein n=1 Tax=Polaribacter cellanae TaxID=2818493 RepID=A0A975CQY0_9FLAO|nr:DUF4377 domain-containing protein [Polaribacter cellanae]QTE21581.1 DUF4377 domain-containing protein [Polaribacter cellanae]
MVTKTDFFARYLIAFLVVLMFFSCNNSEEPSNNEKIYIVASKKTDCVGVGPQKCFLIKESKEENWQYFYSSFDGFNYEEDFEYKILVSETEIENPPQDTSSIEYKLIKVISKTKKTSENLPK